MTVVREGVWTYLRQHCNSFASMSADAVFSDIFTLNTVGVMTEELRSVFFIQQSNQSICSSCNNAIIKSTSIFVLYIISLNLHYNQFEDSVSGAILPSSRTLYCELCQENSGDISMLQHVVTFPTFLSVELSPNYINKIFFPLTMNVLGEYYVLKGMVRCISHHFTVALKDDTSWVYIDDMCVAVRSYTSFEALLHEHFDGWFFGIFEKSSVGVNNNNENNNNCDNYNIQKKSVRCETLQQDCNTLLFGTSPTHEPTFSADKSDIGCITKSSAIAFYAICFSVIKHCSYWNSDTSDAIVEHGNASY